MSERLFGRKGQVTRRAVSILLILCMIFSFGSFASAGLPVPVSIEIGSVSGAPKDTVTVAVYMDSGDYPFAEFAMTLNYDLNVFEEVQAGDVRFTSMFSMNPSVTPGKNGTTGTLALQDLSLISEKEQVFSIQFKIKNSAAAGSSSISVASGTATYTPTTGGSPQSISDANITSGTFTVTGTSDTTTPTVTQATYTAISALKPHLKLTFSENVKAVAGKNMVLKKALDDSTIVTINAGDTNQVSVSGATILIDPAAVLSYGTNYYVLIDSGAFKDIANNNFAGFADKTGWPFATEAAVPQTVTVGIGSASGKVGAAVEVPVSVTAASAGVGAYGMRIDYDKTALEVTGITGQHDDHFMSYFSNKDGWLKAVWTDASGGDKSHAAGSGMFKIQFKIKDEAAIGDKILTVSSESDVQSFTFTDVAAVEMIKTLTAGKVTVSATPPTLTATTTVVTAAPNPSKQGMPLTLTAIVSAASGTPTGGTVEFFEGTTSLGTVTVVGGTASLVTIPLNGMHTITATYSGDTNFSGSTSEPYIVSVVRGDSSAGGTSPSPSASSASESIPTGVDVLVNGKAENAGTATTDTVNGQTVTVVVVDQGKLEARLAAEGQGAVISIPINIQSDKVIGELNGQMVSRMEQQQAVIEIRTDKATYTLPAKQIDIQSISEQVGRTVSLQDIKVRIEMAVPSADMMKVVASSASAGMFEIVVPPLEFTVKAIYGDLTIDITRFQAYVERSIAIPEGVDPNKITTGVVVDPDGAVRHVPTQIVNRDGRYYAVVNSLTNSLYSIVWHPLVFKDVADHWAKDAVNNMGSRMVINGTGNDIFNPDQDTTRAEFAAIMVRGLGLKLERGTSSFTDVRDSDWYSSAVQTAYSYKLLSGFEDGSFRPMDKITREQAMTIIARTMAVSGLKAKLPTTAAEQSLDAFTDGVDIAEWAKSDIADCLKAGIVSGRSATELAPKAYITRAEVAYIVKKLLQKSELI
ncbi:S-layer homology domain-containing protein [Paenibacillus sp. WQ 127069]|uniref:S-layer homology domain-containing protein n=1 Tax=Paenibacillus baimaensis TaxID=2982185 RepID=A0ABT2UDZ9_9BACL|nr:S-layer homology domain-containing protein [Paenibacillus sp. WQ 127069]MCU6792872.1 S-layer homology domain-containing protein [Paenibacillus sp. WQ 127069]